MKGPNFRRSHRHQILVRLAERHSLTTAELAGLLEIDPYRCGEIVGDMRAEHVLEAGAKQRDGSFRWLTTEIGDRELARLDAAETGVPYRDPSEDAIVEANMRRNLGGGR